MHCELIGARTSHITLTLSQHYFCYFQHNHTFFSSPARYMKMKQASFSHPHIKLIAKALFVSKHFRIRKMRKAPVGNNRPTAPETIPVCPTSVAKFIENEDSR